TSNTNEGVNAAHGATTASIQATAVNSTIIKNISDVVICSFFASQPNNLQIDNEDLQQIHLDDLEEIDLRWQMAMLTIRARRFLKNIERKFYLNGNETIGSHKSKVECYNCHKRGHFARECRAPRIQDAKHKESTKKTMPVKTPALAALVSCDGLDGYDWSDQAEDGPTNFALMEYSFTNSNSEKLGSTSGIRACGEALNKKILLLHTSTSNTNEGVNAAHGATTASIQATAVNSTIIKNISDVVICSFFASQPNNLQIDNEDLQQIHLDDLEEIDLRWQMAMLTIRARRFLKNIERKFYLNGNETIGTPALSLMRPFGCLVTILNTKDQLGKFNGNADERFFVGYSLNSKAFRVFNNRTRIVEENLHIRFSENTPNITRSGPN
nr:retrovirus-related Pol polyprotein from transposon TNT 1-94 [Tanacetum cinerariifolium]